MEPGAGSGSAAGWAGVSRSPGRARAPPNEPPGLGAPGLRHPGGSRRHPRPPRGDRRAGNPGLWHLRRCSLRPGRAGAAPRRQQTGPTAALTAAGPVSPPIPIPHGRDKAGGGRAGPGTQRGLPAPAAPGQPPQRRPGPYRGRAPCANSSPWCAHPQHTAAMVLTSCLIRLLRRRKACLCALQSELQRIGFRNSIGFIQVLLNICERI